MLYFGNFIKFEVTKKEKERMPLRLTYDGKKILEMKEGIEIYMGFIYFQWDYGVGKRISKDARAKGITTQINCDEVLFTEDEFLYYRMKYEGRNDPYLVNEFLDKGYSYPMS